MDALFSIYPVPADTFITLHLPDMGRSYKIFLFDHTGRMVRHYIIAGGIQTIQVADLEEGDYQIRIISKQEKIAAQIGISRLNGLSPG